MTVINVVCGDTEEDIRIGKAEHALMDAIEKVFTKHKSTDLVCCLGVLFAQGLAKCSDEEREFALEQFGYRLWKHCQLACEIKPPNESEQTTGTAGT
jgi:hypothetical protein